MYIKGIKVMGLLLFAAFCFFIGVILYVVARKIGSKFKFSKIMTIFKNVNKK